MRKLSSPLLCSARVLPPSPSISKREQTRSFPFPFHPHPSISCHVMFFLLSSLPLLCFFLSPLTLLSRPAAACCTVAALLDAFISCVNTYALFPTSFFSVSLMLAIYSVFSFAPQNGLTSRHPPNPTRVSLNTLLKHQPTDLLRGQPSFNDTELSLRPGISRSRFHIPFVFALYLPVIEY